MTSTESEADMCCASCGIAEVDNTKKLRTCTACKSVRYCSVNCQRDNWPKHKRACKKRAAELHDEILFRQPESSHLGDCPICLLPLEIDNDKSTMMSCCSKLICDGCSHANMVRAIEGSLEYKCAFCRHPIPDTEEEMDLNVMKRIKANDPVAIREKGTKYYEKGDYASALDCWTKAAKLGDIDAHFRLGKSYHFGEGVKKDINKQTYHWEIAAIGGHPNARHNLGCEEWNSGNFHRGVAHFIISANHGHGLSIEILKKGYSLGCVAKEDFAAALRAHQAAVDAMQSPQRKAAAEARQNQTWPYLRHSD